MNEIKSFGTERYKIFNTNINNETLNIINSFNIKKDCTFDYYSFDMTYDEFTDRLNKFVQSIGDNSEEDIRILCTTIKMIYDSVVIGYGAEAYWLTIRVNQPNEDFAVPRWHIDGIFNPDKSETAETKFIMTLKGDHTLLVDCDNDEVNYFRTVQREVYSDVYKNFSLEKDLAARQQLIENVSFLNDKSKIKVPVDGQAIIFQTIKLGNGAIHSEPNIEKSRIFLSILPSSEKSLTDFKNRSKRK